MKAEFVIASHNDELRWIALWECLNAKLQIIPDYKFTAYNTGEPRDGFIQLENKGREAGQWLSHIVRNYDNLADVTFFFQADLGWGTGGNWKKWPPDLNALKKMEIPEGIDGESFYTWPGLNRIDASSWKKEPLRHSGSEFNEVWGFQPETLMVPTAFVACFWGAQFVVTREFIRRLPLAHYEKCLEYAHKNHHLSWFLEMGKWPIFIFDLYKQGPLR